MKTKNRNLRRLTKTVCLVLCMIGMLLCAEAVSTKAEAATVKKVTISSSFLHPTIKGKTSKGKVMWTYRCSACKDLVGYQVKGNYVYVMDKTTFLRIGKQTGKVYVKKKISMSCDAAIWMTTTSAGKTYVISEVGNGYLYKLNKNGKVEWKKKVAGGNVWGVKYKSGTIRVELDDYIVAVSPKTGKIVRRISYT